MNLGSAMATAGSVGLNRTASQLVYIDHIPIRGMSLHYLEIFIKKSVDLVEAWRNLLSSREFMSAKAEFVSATNGDFGATIRISFVAQCVDHPLDNLNTLRAQSGLAPLPAPEPAVA
jgi:hypothetical protein